MPVQEIGDRCSIPGREDPPEGGHSHQIQYSSLENPMVRGAGSSDPHRVAESPIRVKQLNTQHIERINY